MTARKEPHCPPRQPPEDDFHHQEAFKGTGAVYVMSEHFPGLDVFTGDYLIDFQHDTYPEQVRAMRLEQGRDGQPLGKLPPEALRHQVLIVFGAEVTPDQAIRDLERTIKAIKEEGLLAGQNSSGDIVWEPSSRSR